MKRLFSLLLFCLLCSAGNAEEPFLEEGCYRLISIESTAGSDTWAGSEGLDSLVLRDGEFSYSISRLDKEGEGRYTIKKGTLTLFHSSPPDSILKYSVSREGQQIILKNKDTYLRYISAQSVFENRDTLSAQGDVKAGFWSIAIGFVGIIVFLGIAFLCSSDRKSISWKLVAKGIAAQLIFAYLVLEVEVVAGIFDTVSRGFVQITGFAMEGTQFLFNSYQLGKMETAVVSFAFMVLPTIVFFSAFTSLLYYYGILQKIVYALAFVMKKIFGISGAESLSAAGNIFLGQTEAPFLVKPYLPTMTKSELMCLMTGGMATIAGGVLAAFIGMLGDTEMEKLFFTRHLLAASVMSAPAAIVVAKMLVPEKEKFDSSMEIPKNKIGTNVLEAVANGTTDGLKLAINVGAMLLVFISLVAMANFGLKELIGEWTGANTWIAANTRYEGLSFQFILGHIGAPLAYLAGVPVQDVLSVGQLLGEKTVLNEFYAYTTLSQMKDSGILTNPKSIVIATYILCGFSNFASIGIQIGGISVLAPGKKAQISQLGVRALIGGTLACLLTACVAGILFHF